MRSLKLLVFALLLTACSTLPKPPTPQTLEQALFITQSQCTQLRRDAMQNATRLGYDRVKAVQDTANACRSGVQTVMVTYGPELGCLLATDAQASTCSTDALAQLQAMTALLFKVQEALNGISPK